MKKGYLIILGVISFILWLTYPWIITAGGHGNIELYEFSVKRNELSLKIDSLVRYDSLIGIPSKRDYNNDETGYEDDSKYIFHAFGRKKIVFYYEYSQMSSENKTIIALVCYGKYGTPLKSKSNTFFFERIYAKNNFKKLLNKLNLSYRVID